jgi:hypothetical protein
MPILLADSALPNEPQRDQFLEPALHTPAVDVAGLNRQFPRHGRPLERSERSKPEVET